MHASLSKMDDLVHYFASNEDTFDLACESNEYSGIYTRSPTNGVHSLMPENVSPDIDSSLSQSVYGYSKALDHYHPRSFRESNQMPQRLPPEVEAGNIEYKRSLVNPTPDRFEHLVTQMKWRLTAGGGSAIYRLGVDDNGFVNGLPSKELDKSVQTLQRMACRLNATIHPLRNCVVPVQPLDQNASVTATAESNERKAVEFLICQSPTVNDGKLDVCVAILGGVDAGKSTLIGVLTDGELDNGHGRARLNLFRHLHEVQSGRTSSSTCKHLGFDARGQVTNYSRANGAGGLTRHSIDEVLRKSTHLITLLDLAGHYKYQRTTLSGLARRQPIAALLVISAITGLTPVGLQHAQLAFSLNLPFAVVITKVDQLTSGNSGRSRTRRIGDICSNILQQLSKVKAIGRSLSMAAVSGVSHWSNFSLDVCTNRKDDLPLFFPVSSVSGFGIDRLLRFLSRLGQTPLSPDHISVEQQEQQSSRDVGQQADNEARHPPSASAVNSRATKFLASLDSEGLQTSCRRQLDDSQPPPAPGSLFWVNQVFTRVPGVPNTILFGTLQTGRLTLGQRVWLGPHPSGDFRLVQIMSLMRNRQSHSVISAGQTATIAIHFLSPSEPSLPVESTASGHHHQQSFEHFFFGGAGADDEDDDENQPVSASGSENAVLRRRLTQPSGRCPGSSVVRRGMVLVSEDARASLSRSDDGGRQAVAWTVELALTRRLLTSAQKNQFAVLPPLPTPQQRVILHAGCVLQSVQVMPRLASCGSAGTGDEDEDKTMASVGSSASVGQNSADDNHNLFVSFTRGPEFLEVGRQVIISWAGCAIAVGYVAALHDTVQLPPLKACYQKMNTVALSGLPSLPTAAVVVGGSVNLDSPCVEADRSEGAFNVCLASSSPAALDHHQPQYHSASASVPDGVGVKPCELSTWTGEEAVRPGDEDRRLPGGISRGSRQSVGLGEHRLPSRVVGEESQAP